MKNLRLICAIVVLCGVCIMFQGCGVFVRDNAVVKAVEKQGYRNVKVTSSHVLFVSWRGCSGSDDAAYKMLATNAFGQKVELIACAGWPFKGVTVRTE